MCFFSLSLLLFLFLCQNNDFAFSFIALYVSLFSLVFLSLCSKKETLVSVIFRFLLCLPRCFASKIHFFSFIQNRACVCRTVSKVSEKNRFYPLSLAVHIFRCHSKNRKKVSVYIDIFFASIDDTSSKPP